MTTPDLIIFVVPQTLSDGSTVFDVRLTAAVLNAVTEYDANELASKIAEAIEEHTNSTAGVMFEAA